MEYIYIIYTDIYISPFVMIERTPSYGVYAGCNGCVGPQGPVLKVNGLVSAGRSLETMGHPLVTV